MMNNGGIKIQYIIILHWMKEKWNDKIFIYI